MALATNSMQKLGKKKNALLKNLCMALTPFLIVDFNYRAGYYEIQNV